MIQDLNWVYDFISLFCKTFVMFFLMALKLNTAWNKGKTTILLNTKSIKSMNDMLHKLWYTSSLDSLTKNYIN